MTWEIFLTALLAVAVVVMEVEGSLYDVCYMLFIMSSITT